jgi:phage baseplate assembly protein V
MADFFDLLKAPAGQARETLAQPRLAVVTSSNPQTATARVLLQPEGVLSGWLPVLTQWVGSGWGISCPPSPGDQVLVIPQEGDPQHGLIIGRVFSNQVRPPEAQTGEIVIRHQSGCSIRLANSGVIVMQGDLHVSGDVYDSYGSLSHLRNDYDAHVHQVEGDITLLPIPQD